MVVTSYEAPIKVFIFLMVYKQIFTAAFEEISPRFVGRIETEQEKVGESSINYIPCTCSAMFIPFAYV